MFKIGEFSKLTQVTIRMLRYYDETGLLKPAGTDPMTGYRMYAAEQIPVLNRIIYLRDSGFGVADIAAALKCRDDQEIAALLEEKYRQTRQNIRLEQEKLKRIELARQALLDGKGDMHYNISIKSIPSCQVLSLRRVIPNYYAEGDLWQELSRFAGQRKISTSEQTFSIYHDMEYREADVDVELCVPVDETGRDEGDLKFRLTEAVPVMACTMVYGPFSNIAGVYRSFAGWLEENSGYEMGSCTRQIVHRGPWNEEKPENYLTEIQIPLTRRSENKVTFNTLPEKQQSANVTRFAMHRNGKKRRFAPLSLGFL